MKKCPFCSAELEDNASFCLYCMKSFDKKENIAPIKPNKKENRITFLVISILIVLVAIIAIIGFVCSKNGFNSFNILGAFAGENSSKDNKDNNGSFYGDNISEENFITFPSISDCLSSQEKFGSTYDNITDNADKNFSSQPSALLDENNLTSNQTGTSSHQNQSNSTQNIDSKPSNSTSQKTSSSKPIVNKNPCADGHTWKAATCTTPATCSVCKKTSGQAKGHNIFTTKCSICKQIDYSKIAGTYTDASGFYSSPYEEFEITSFTINSSGILSFSIKGVNYSFKLVETSSDYHWESNFDCYSLNATKDTDVTASANLDSSRTLLIFHLEWDYFDGRDLYFSGEKQV